MTLKAKVQQLTKENSSEILAVRRHLHANPELSFKEFETSKFIVQKLNEYGIEVERNIANTGIIAYVKGKNPDKKVVALRADIDALPIFETNNVPYKSKNEGIMHACGHDVHTSCLLGAAKVLTSLKDEFEGTVKLLFQPGEELLPGGASIMIKEGALQNPAPENIVGQHVMPFIPAGKVGFRSGMYMASADEIYIVVRAKGGHAGMPELAIDPILITSHILSDLDELTTHVMYLQDGKMQFLKNIETLREDTGELKLGKAIARIMKGEDPTGNFISEVLNKKN